MKAYLDKKDIMERYGVGMNKAVGIIAAVKRVCDGGQLPAGKILPAELRYWEELRNRISERTAQEEKKLRSSGRWEP